MKLQNHSRKMNLFIKFYDSQNFPMISFLATRNRMKILAFPLGNLIPKGVERKRSCFVINFTKVYCYLHDGDDGVLCGGWREFCVCQPFLNAYVWNDDAVTDVGDDVHGYPGLFGDGRCHQRGHDVAESMNEGPNGRGDRDDVHFATPSN